MIALTPLLTQAISFLFDEGKKILEERRARRQNTPTSVLVDTNPEKEQKPQSMEKVGVISSKEEALKQEVPQAVWNNSEAKIKHLMTMLKIQTNNYYLAKEQYNIFGKGMVPQIISYNLSEAEDGVAKTTSELEAELSKVYGKKIVIPEA
jgi:hypothetical protein